MFARRPCAYLDKPSMYCIQMNSVYEHPIQKRWKRMRRLLKDGSRRVVLFSNEFSTHVRILCAFSPAYSLLKLSNFCLFWWFCLFCSIRLQSGATKSAQFSATVWQLLRLASGTLNTCGGLQHLWCFCAKIRSHAP